MSEENVTGNDNDLEKKKISVKQNKFKHIIVPSLQEISMSCIVTTIYKQQDVLEIILQPGNDEKEKLTEVERNLEQKLIQLPMPSSLMDKALSFCKFVAFQGSHTLGLTKKLINRYEKCRCGFDFSIPLEYFDCLCFKMDCTVDKLKTFTLLSETDYPDYKIFIAASHLCSKELAYKSWEKISPLCLKSSCGFYKVLRQFQDDKYGKYDCRINTYWLRFVNNKLSELGLDLFEGRYGLICSESLFQYALAYDNSMAYKYFVQLLFDDEKEYNMERWMDGVRISTWGLNLTIGSNLECCDIYLFMLSETNDVKKQIQELRNHMRFLIPIFVLNVAYEKFFEPVMQFIWDSLDQNDFCYILKTIFGIIGVGNRRAAKLFKELWYLCSKSVRKWCSSDFVRALFSMTQFPHYHLFENEVFECVKLLLSESPNDMKGDRLYSLVRDNKLRSSIIGDINYLNEIDNFLGQILSSEQGIGIFKKRVCYSCNFEIILHFVKLDDYDSVNQFLEWALTSGSEVESYKRYSIEKNELFFRILYDLLYDYEKANKFLNWCFTSQNEVDEYKRDFEFMKDVLRRIIVKEPKLEEAQKFVNWCLNSKSEIKQFKKDFLDPAYSTFFNFEAYCKCVEWCLEDEQDLNDYKKSEFEHLISDVSSGISRDEFDGINKWLDFYYRQKRINRVKVTPSNADSDEIDYPLIREMAKKFSLWYGSVGIERILELKQALERKMWELEEGVEMDENPFTDNDQERFLKLVEELVENLLSDHKFLA